MADWRVLLIVTMLCAAVALTLAFFRRVPEKFSLSCLACCMLFCIACVRLDFFLKYVSHDVLQATTITITRMLICAVSVIFCSASLLFFLCCVSCFGDSLKESKCVRAKGHARPGGGGGRAHSPHTHVRAWGEGGRGAWAWRARARASQLSLSLSLHYPLLCLLQQQAACGPELPRRGRGPSSTRASPRASWPGGTTTWAHPRAARASWAAAACARRGHAHEAQAEGAPDSAPAWSDLALSLTAGRPA
jgi:hypothetical protein